MFSAFSDNVNSWFGATKGDSPEKELIENETSDLNKENPEETKPPEPNEKQDEEKADHDSTNDLDEMGTKAITTAKEWGSWLYGIGMTAGQELAKSAKNIKETVEEKTIIGDFEKEQKKFVTIIKEKKQKSEAAVPPWVGYNEEEEMKKQILSLSEDRRNFLRNPPAGVQFKFDFEAAFPVAMATLAEDKNLEKMRFGLVPKQIKEQDFWRNYFYRVSLIKQSAQLSTLAQQTGENPEKVPAESSKPKDIPSSSDRVKEEELQSSSPPDNEFVSDAFDQSEFNTDELKKGLQELGVGDKKEGEVPDWEKELQAELQEYEVVADGGAEGEDDDLEEELLKQIEEETN